MGPRRAERREKGGVSNARPCTPSNANAHADKYPDAIGSLDTVTIHVLSTVVIIVSETTKTAKHPLSSTSTLPPPTPALPPPLQRGCVTTGGPLQTLTTQKQLFTEIRAQRQRQTHLERFVFCLPKTSSSTRPFICFVLFLVFVFITTVCKQSQIIRRRSN